MRSLISVAFFGVVLIAGCGPSIPDADPAPPGKTFAGTWDSNWGRITLHQRGSHVHGTYEGFRNGSISGSAEGDLLLFNWTQTESRQWGRGYFKMSPDGGHLEGRWGYNKNRTNGGRWWANRSY
jgi:hypothetical protein